MEPSTTPVQALVHEIDCRDQWGLSVPCGSTLMEKTTTETPTMPSYTSPVSSEPPGYLYPLLLLLVMGFMLTGPWRRR
jgi:hypothetical protein